ncbi:hypothetical protein D3C71_1846030 [compost metagenome]
MSISVGIGAISCADRQLARALQHIANAGHHRFSRTQSRLDGSGIGRVLIDHRSLLTQLQQARSTYRIISCSVDANQTAGLFTAFDRVREILLIVRSRRLVKLGGRNAHGLRLLKDC